MEIRIENQVLSTVIVGANGGLGSALVNHIEQAAPKLPLILITRQEFDLSRPEQVENLITKLNTHAIERLIYCPGGGPFGYFHEKNWKDHLWAWQVSFVSPARILHWALQRSEIRQLVFVGSAIAEAQPDPRAASYCAAKHALRGLVTSVQQENAQLGNSKDIRLFSPGYMDTKMLPKNALPREQGLPILAPQEVAKNLWQQLFE